jgi:hypothetical protein
VQSVSIIQRLSWILNILFHQAVAVIIVYILSVTFINEEVNSLGTWHMVLTPIGVRLTMIFFLLLHKTYFVDHADNDGESYFVHEKQHLHLWHGKVHQTIRSHRSSDHKYGLDNSRDSVQNQ